MSIGEVVELRSVGPGALVQLNGAGFAEVLEHHSSGLTSVRKNLKKGVAGGISYVHSGALVRRAAALDSTAIRQTGKTALATAAAQFVLEKCVDFAAPSVWLPSLKTFAADEMRKVRNAFLKGQLTVEDVATVVGVPQDAVGMVVEAWMAQDRCKT